MKKVAVFTGTRAEYGLLYWLMKDIESDVSLQLQLLVSGMHLSPEFGLTYKQIEEDGFVINEKVEILLSSDSPVGVAKSMGLGVLGFSDALNRMRPDILVVLGDRFEALAVAQTAMILRIPVLHVHGGEITEGAYDDSIRHAISKLSYLHAVSTQEHRNRVVQLGEDPSRVKNVGALGLDHLKRSKFMSFDQLSTSLGFELEKPFFIVTYHPVTLASEEPERSFNALRLALDNFPDYQVIITYPNADDGGRRIIPLIESYVSENSERIFSIPSLGYARYLSALNYCSAVIGNSSSGIIEVPSFFKPTINIGARQRGRLSASSVIHCEVSEREITSAIQRGVDMLLGKDILGTINPYGCGNASHSIVEMIKGAHFDSVKVFHDIPVGFLKDDSEVYE